MKPVTGEDRKRTHARLPHIHQHSALLWQHIWLPLAAIVGLGVIDRHARSLATWLVNLGWDSCVLSLGAAPSVFASESAAKLFGDKEFATYAGFAYVLLSLGLVGSVIGRFRGEQDHHDGHAFVSLGIGGALLGTLMYVATSS